MPSVDPSTDPRRFGALNRAEFAGLLGILLAILVFGYVVIDRSSLSDRVRTDAQVFFRAGHAALVQLRGPTPVPKHLELYNIQDANGWHYIYPSLFAVTMIPFADAPPDAPAFDRPSPVAIGAWYVLTLAAALWSAHLLARAAELAIPSLIRPRPDDPPIPWHRRRSWWTLRIWPLLAVAPDLGSTLSRGQVNTLLLLGVAAAAYCLAVRRHALAGLCLAASICLKIIPGFLLLFPVIRRDVRFTLGCAAGGLLGLVILPGAVFGPATMVDYNIKWLEKVGLPGLGMGKDQSRADELTDFRNTDNQSIQGIIHNSMHVATPRPERPERPAAWVRPAHALIGAAFTLATIWVALAGRISPAHWWRRRPSYGPVEIVLLLGLLTAVMLIVSPVTHRHYFVLLLPTWTALLALMIDPSDGRLRRGAVAGVLVYVAATTAPRLTGVDLIDPVVWALRDFGLAQWASIALWAVGARVLWTRLRSADRDAAAAPSAVPA